jgi:hypothetical protein
MIDTSRESILRSGVGSMAECLLFAGDSSNGNDTTGCSQATVKRDNSVSPSRLFPSV